MKYWYLFLRTGCPQGMCVFAVMVCTIRLVQGQTTPVAFQEPPIVSATQLTEQQQSQLAIAQQLNDEALALQQEKQFSEALIKFHESLRIRQSVLGDEDLLTASSLNCLGYVYRKTDEFAQAEKYYQQALAIIEKKLGEENRDTAVSLNNLAHLYTLQGDYLKAKPLHERALKIREKIFGADDLMIANSLNNLAFFYRNLGNYSKAEQLYERALNIKVEVEGRDNPKLATILNNLATLHTWMGHYDQAMKLNERSRQLIRNAPGDNRKEIAVSLSNLALLAMMTGDYATAEAKYTEALTISKNSSGDDSLDTAKIQSGLGLLYATLGDTAKAKTSIEQSLAKMTRILGAEHQDTVRIRGNLALLYHSMGDDDRAEELSKECLKIRMKVLGEEHSETAASLLNLGRIYQDRGDLQKAETNYQRALAIQRQVLGNHHSETAGTLGNLGLLELDAGNPDGAEKWIGQSLAIRRDLLDITATIQSERQQLLMNQNVRKSLDDWLSIPTVANETAYAEVLRWKGAVYVRQAALRALRAQPELESLVEQLRNVSTQLANFVLDSEQAGQGEGLQNRLQDLNEQRQKLEIELSQKSQLHRQAHNVAKLTLPELQHILPKKTALVDLFEYDHYQPIQSGEQLNTQRERRFVAFVVRPDRLQVERIELGSAKTIDDLVDLWHSFCRDTENSPLKKPSQQLYRRLWLPLKPHLEGIETVLISPDGSLGKLPFAALPAAEKSEAYLLEEIAVVTIPVPQSLSKLLQPDKSPRAEFDLLVVCGIEYGGDSVTDAESVDAIPSPYAGRGGRRRVWDNLPATAGEGLDVQNKFQLKRKEGKVRFLQQSAPTEELIKELAPQYRYLHFATHGYFAAPEFSSALDTRRGSGNRSGSAQANFSQYLGLPLGVLSGLALANANEPGEEDDGTLTALEVDGLDLSKTRLVVLSACETGLGRVAGGEGVLGLQRSFQLAGARSVVATLWKVDDSRTRDLMGQFYESYWDEKLSTIECLRQAQLSMLRLPPDRAVREGHEDEVVEKPRLPPHFWAAFVLSGDWR